jgi:hypothetical protein
MHAHRDVIQRVPVHQHPRRVLALRRERLVVLARRDQRAPRAARPRGGGGRDGARDLRGGGRVLRDDVFGVELKGVSWS